MRMRSFLFTGSDRLHGAGAAKLTLARLGLTVLCSTFLACGSATPAASSVSEPSHHEWRIASADSAGADTAAQSLRAAYVKSVQADLAPVYLPRSTGTAAFRTESPAQHLSAALREDGVHVSVTAAAAESPHGEASFRLRHFGCEGELGAPVAAARPALSGARVSYRRDGLTEWYKNGRLGLEQGFDLQNAPACKTRAESAQVVLALEVAHGLRASLMHAPDGSSFIDLRDDENRLVLRYSDLYVEDADHKMLPSSMSLDGNVVSLRFDDRGAHYPVRVDPLIWAQLGGAYKASSPKADDQFGAAVAIDGDHAIIGAPLDDDAGADAGAAYVFTMNSQGLWSQQAKLTGAKAGAHFGAAVAIASVGGDKRLVIGAPNDGGGNGLAAWFRGRGNSYTAEAEFSGMGLFGAAVATSAGRVLVGAPATDTSDGAAVLYEPDVTMSPPWAAVMTAKGATGGAERLGSSVALDGEVAVVGSPADSSVMMSAGSAAVYQRTPAGTWKNTATLRASDGAKGDRFGDAVAVSGLTVAVGAPARSSGAGGAYVYASSLGKYSEQALLHSVSGVSLAAGDGFGGSLSLVGNLLAVGAPGTAALGNSGAGQVYLLGRSGAAWSISGVLTARTPAAQEGFGNSVSLDRGLGHVLIGASLNDVTASNSGAFYDLIQRKQNGDACAAASECASDLCVDGVCCNSTCGGGSDGDCQACSVAKGAVKDGVCGTTQAAAAFVCRPAAGICDQAEVCDGASTACPNDAFQAATTICRPAAGACDVAEMCTGASAICPVDLVQPAQRLCRPAAGDCDLAEFCDGESKACPADLLAPPRTICSVPTDDCHVVKLCSGVSVSCDTANLAADGTKCFAGTCRAGVCRPEADLSLSLIGQPTANADGTLPYTITVSNIGPVTPGGVVISITLPADAQLVSTSANDITCRSTQSGEQCAVTSLTPGQLAQLIVFVRPPGQADTMTITAAVSSNIVDPNPTNNSASFTQSLLSARISGSGIGCSAIPGGGSSGGASPYGPLSLALLLSLSLIAGPLPARRRRS
jgi:uncharacterized repeat protein (TIGR01451 family)